LEKGALGRADPQRGNNTVGSLRAIFDLALKRGLITANPAASVIKVKVPPTELDLPSVPQFHAIVKAVRESGSATRQGNGDMVEFLCYSVPSRSVLAVSLCLPILRLLQPSIP
jgi:hypothetical protein